MLIPGTQIFSPNCSDNSNERNVFKIDADTTYNCVLNQNLIQVGPFYLHGVLNLRGKLSVITADNDEVQAKLIRLASAVKAEYPLTLTETNNFYSMLIEHNLGRRPRVLVVSDEGERFEPLISHLSLNDTKISSLINITGKIYLF